MLHLSLFLIILIARKNIASSTSGREPQAFFSVFSIDVHYPPKGFSAAGLGSSPKLLTVGYLTVDFHRPIWVHREAKADDPLSNLDYYPDAVDTWLGLAKFSCPGANISLRTTTKVEDGTGALSEGILYTLAESERTQYAGSLATAIAKSIYTPVKTPRINTNASGTQTLQRYDAVYFSDEAKILGSSTKDKSDNSRSIATPDQIMEQVRFGRCSVDFLSEAEQLSQKGSGTNPGRIMLANLEEGGIASFFEGSVTVLPFDKARGSNLKIWPRKLIPALGWPWATSRFKDALDRASHSVSEEHEGEEEQLERSKDVCVDLPHGIEAYASQMENLQTGFVEVSSETMAHVGSIAQEIPKLIKTPVSDVLKPITKLMGGFLGETLVQPLKEQMGQLTSAGMVDQIDEGLSGALIKSLSKGIPATTLETIPFVVSEGLAESLMTYVTEQVTHEVTDPLADRLGSALSATVPKEVDTEAVDKLAERVSSATIHSLTRSLSHSIVPALVHTLTHSPLQDFYCYYCFHHKAYCQYCSYAPSQLYYAMYYSGYYSTYYSDYYG